MSIERAEEFNEFAACRDVSEVALVLHRLLGMEGVDRAFGGAGLNRESLREAAARLDAVGLRPLAMALRRHARRAKPSPKTNFKKRWKHKASLAY
jgi:hypothetical protein